MTDSMEHDVIMSQGPSTTSLSMDFALQGAEGVFGSMSHFFVFPQPNIMMFLFFSLCFRYLAARSVSGELSIFETEAVIESASRLASSTATFTLNAEEGKTKTSEGVLKHKQAKAKRNKQKSSKHEHDLVFGAEEDKDEITDIRPEVGLHPNMLRDEQEVHSLEPSTQCVSCHNM